MADSPSSLKSTESYLAASLNLSDVTAATARTNLNVMRCLFESFADIGNVGTGEDDLRSHTLVAGQLATNGDKLRIFAAGTVALHASNTRQIKMYFGGTVVFTSNAFTSTTAQSWVLQAEVIRVSNTVVRVSTSMTRGADAASGITFYANYVEITPSSNLSSTQIMKWTGAISAGADNDITQKQSSIVYIPAA